MRLRPMMSFLATLVVLVSASYAVGKMTAQPHRMSKPSVARVHRYAAPTPSGELGSAIIVGAFVVGLVFRQKVRVESV